MGLGGILIVALRDRGAIDAPPELVATGRVQQADGLAQLPRDYAGVPRLGPPLPGDLGRPILAARERGAPVQAPRVAGPAAAAVDPDEQRRLQEIEAARLSRLFTEATTAVPAQPPGPAASAGRVLPTAETFYPVGAAESRTPGCDRSAGAVSR